MQELTITDSALRCRLSYPQMLRLVLRGEVRSRRTANGRFLVSREDVERIAAARSVDSVPAV